MKPKHPRGRFWRGSLFERLIAKTIIVNDCLIFTGHKNPQGYGKTNLCGRQKFAHRAAWECADGEVPEGKFVLHHCDTPACVLLDHLFIGTHQTNMDDMKAKGRHRCAPQKRGEDAYGAKLTDAQVLSIRKEHDGIRGRRKYLAAKYGVSPRNIGMIVRRETWKHI